MLSADHRQVQPLLASAIDGDLVAGIGVAHHPGTRVVGQHAGDARGGFVREWLRPDERRFVNVGYALQWWAFAATTCALWLVLSFRRKPMQARKG